jgi:predicted DNA-binding protein (MmcQ/YjbR family)
LAVRDRVRKICLAQPHATEQVQWGSDLVFKVGGKMFAVTNLEPGPYSVSFKASDEEFAELTERPGFVPAPYLARAKWVALETGTRLPLAELSRLLKTSYELVRVKLPRKVQRELAVR